VGYNYQVDRWLWGVEADASYANLKGSDIESGTALFPPASLANITAVGEQSLNFFGTLRGRAGFLPTNSLLVYATGGLAYGHAESNTNTSDAGAPILTAPASGSASRMLAGWTAGGGLEAALPFSSAWRFKIEYLYYDLGKLTYTLSPAVVCAGGGCPTLGFVTTTASANFYGSVVRIGLNYEFH
jgi:outer membrane immunogenic protein